MKRESLLYRALDRKQNLDEGQRNMSNNTTSRCSNKVQDDIAMATARYLLSDDARAAVLQNDKHLADELLQSDIIREWFGDTFAAIVPKQVLQSFYVLWVEAGSPNVKDYCRKLAESIRPDHLASLAR